jgi:orotate phosphoribosyltransferase
MFRAMIDRARLIDLLVRNSVRRGNFVLASGQRSDLYVDARTTTMDGEGLALIGSLGLTAMDTAGWTPDSVGGLTLGADPVAYAIAHAAALAGRPLRAFTVRKEAKTHGTGKLIEGPFAAGDCVVIVEDVITTGGSALRAADAVRGGGGHVVGALAIVDREEGGRASIEATGIPVRALVTRTELLARLDGR